MKRMRTLWRKHEGVISYVVLLAVVVGVFLLLASYIYGHPGLFHDGTQVL